MRTLRDVVIWMCVLLAPPVGSNAADHPANRAEPFPLEHVRLLQGPFKDALENDRKYLRSLSVDRLLHNFRVNAGLPSKARPLGGWEAPTCELRGHFTGHYMSACAMAYASTRDDGLRRRAMDVVAGLAKCQQTLGKSGYLSAFPESFFDRLESGKDVWAPWYTLHKIGAGLLDVYRYCGDTLALDVLVRMAAWVQQRTSRLDDAQMQQMLKVEHGGMGELLRNLYEISGNPDHLALARRFNQDAFLTPLSEQRDALAGLHANTNIPKVIAAAREYDVSGDQAARREATFFWNDIVYHRSYVTGGTSNYEHWIGEPGKMADQLSADSHENCCTYNMLKLTEDVFRWTADPAAADYFERALFNAILPTQKAGDGSGIMYYVPMKSGLFKMFGDPDSSFWCCTGTGIESFAKLQRGIYFHDSAGVFVNLYVASELRWPQKGLVLRQDTRFPDEEGSTLIIQSAPQQALTIHLRIPGWTAPDAATIELNGARLTQATRPSSYATVTRAWKSGDRLSIHLPMGLHCESPADDSSLAAVMYGPIVLAGELGTRGVSDAIQRGFETPEVDTALFDSAPVETPVLVIPATDITSWIQRVPGHTLAFRTVRAGKPHDVTLVPFFRLFGQPYAIYWRIMGEVNWEIFEQLNDRLPEGVVDEVKAGDRVSGREHNFQAFRCDTGSTNGHSWVQAPYGIRYDLRVKLDGQDTLRCRFASDGKAYSFDLLIDGRHLATDSLAAGIPGSMAERSYVIPAGMLRGKERVAVRLRGRDGQPTARLSRMAVFGPP